MSSNLDHYVLRSVEDWRWFFQHAKGQMGIKAIDYETMTVRCSGGTVYVVEPLEQQQAAARRHARIEAALQLMHDRGRPGHPPHLRRRPARDVGALPPRRPRQRRPPHAGGAARPPAQPHHEVLGEWLDRLGQKLATGRAIMEDRILQRADPPASKASSLRPTKATPSAGETPMTTHHRTVKEAWPGQFSMAYVARRAGISKWALPRRWKDSPRLTAWLESRDAEGYTKLTLADLVEIDPKLYESITLQDALRGPG
jgi:hypothetical protein